MSSLDWRPATTRFKRPRRSWCWRKPQALTIRAGTQTLNLRLMVASTVQQIVVEENAGPAVSTDAASNATATVLTRRRS